MAPGSSPPSLTRPSLTRRQLLGTAGAVGAGLALSGCGVDRIFRSPDDNTVTWGSWANPGEAKRFYEFNDQYTAQTGVRAQYQTVVGDYATKSLTQLAGRAAPDAFYVNDQMMPTLILEKQVIPLTEYLSSPDAAAAEADYFPGLLDYARGDDGQLYGLPVDCNPLVIWFNSDIMAEAGVDEPGAAFDDGSWTLDTITDVLAAVKTTGKRGMTFESGYGHLFSWITTMGGTLFEDGRPVFQDDPIAVEVIGWVLEQFQAETMAYGGSLPEGQGGEQLFQAQQLGMVIAGRWVLPNLRELDFNYDMVPFPTEDGGTVMPANIACAAMAVNTRAVNPAVALDFLGAFVNADGQRFRLSGGGNAVPSLGGLEEVVTEGGVPKHGALFLECAETGYAMPREMLRDPRVASRFSPSMDEVMKAGPTDAQSLLVQLADFIADPEKLS